MRIIVPWSIGAYDYRGRYRSLLEIMGEMSSNSRLNLKMEFPVEKMCVCVCVCVCVCACEWVGGCVRVCVILLHFYIFGFFTYTTFKNQTFNVWCPLKGHTLANKLIAERCRLG